MFFNSAAKPCSRVQKYLQSCILLQTHLQHRATVIHLPNGHHQTWALQVTGCIYILPQVHSTSSRYTPARIATNYQARADFNSVNRRLVKLSLIDQTVGARPAKMPFKYCRKYFTVLRMPLIFNLMVSLIPIPWGVPVT